MHSFFEGIRSAFEFVKDSEGKIDTEDINKFLISCGYAEILEENDKG